MYGSATLDLASAVDQADIYVTRWSLEPWTLGAYSAAKPNAWPMREELAKPVRYYTLDARTGQREEHGPERLHFAGEATALLMYNGSFAGAYESGMRAAREMLELLDKEDSSSRGNPSTKSGPGSSLDRIQRGLQPGHARVPASL
jgi:monoamine oxidase